MPFPAVPWSRREARPRRRLDAFWPLWAAAVLLPVLGFAIGARSAWIEVEAEARARLLRSVDMLHEHALRAFETQEAMLEAVDARAAGLDWPGIGTSAGLHRFLLRLQGSAPSVAGIALVDPQGRMVLFSHPDFFRSAPIDVTDRDYVRARRDDPAAGTFVGETVAARPTGVEVFALARPRTGPEGRPDGGLIASSFLAGDFARFYATIRESPGDSVALLRLDGALLSRYPPTPMRRMAADHAVLRALREEGQQRGVEWRRSRVDGVDRLFAWRRVGSYPVAVAYGLDGAVPMAAWRRRVAALGAVCAGAAALLLLLTAGTLRATRRAESALRAAAAEADHARAEAEARAAAEARLRRSEQTAALGLVAAGVAHDMNNLVQSVVAAARLLDRRADDPAEVRRLAGLVGDASERGQRLARRMLEFGRPGPREQDRFDLAPTLQGLSELIGGLLGSGVKLSVAAEPGLPPVTADRREFETVLVNLLVNARDAMPLGGRVQVRASLAREAGRDGALRLPRAGAHIEVTVADEGVGMAPEVLARAGEPFFTTKEAGQGTGLGLMMARHFAERAGGALTLDSRPGEGTAVTLWLPVQPAVAEPARSTAPEPTSAPAAQA